MFLTQTQLKKINKQLGTDIQDIDIIERALTHRSKLNETNEEIKHNERLEFLGDAVLELSITKLLFTDYPNKPEGLLTSFRAALVRTESLAEEALRLGLGQFIIMSKGEENTGGRKRPYILANTMEAVIGAIYLDGGFEKAHSFIEKNIFHKASAIVDNRLDVDAKSKFQEIAQEYTKITPSYDTIEEKGPDHSKVFVMAVMLDSKEFGRGEGKNKQEAEQNAATYALENWEKLYKKHFSP